MSYAPSLRAPGGHIFDVVAQGLKKHVFTAMLAQHVAVSGEGLAPIVSANSRLILVDGTVL